MSFRRYMDYFILCECIVGLEFCSQLLLLGFHRILKTPTAARVLLVSMEETAT